MADAYAAWLGPQAWRRDGGDDPVLTLGAAGAFDAMHVFAPCVLFEDGQYRMYYPGSRGNPDGRNPDGCNPDGCLFRLGHASSADGVHFRKHPEWPVFEVGDDAHSVLTPALLRRGCGQVVREIDRLRLWYSSTDLSGGSGRHTLHQTTSGDGFTWEAPSPSQLEACYAPSVLKVGRLYRLWYSDVAADPWCVRHGVSDDGLTWEVDGDPCLVLDQAWEHERLVYPCVLQPADDLFVMLYGSYAQMDPMVTALGVAVSRDGIAWEKCRHNPVFAPDGAHPWESHDATSQTVLRLPDGRWRIWYAARPAPPFVHKYFAIGTAVWDGPGELAP